MGPWFRWLQLPLLVGPDHGEVWSLSPPLVRDISSKHQRSAPPCTLLCFACSAPQATVANDVSNCSRSLVTKGPQPSLADRPDLTPGLKTSTVPAWAPCYGLGPPDFSLHFFKALGSADLGYKGKHRHGRDRDQDHNHVRVYAEMNNKRAAPGASAGASKKRKVDGQQKFYAVRAGFHPGVYLTYAECQTQTAGFKGAVFKSFTSSTDAHDFVAGKKVQASSDEPEKFYAVAVGSPTGIYTDWTDASEAIKGVKGPKYKRFATRAEAVAYIRKFGNRDAIEALGETVAEPEEPPAKKAKAIPKQVSTTGPQEDILQIYTDGSSLANGKKESRAGLGVFFGNGDPRNLSEKLPGEPQTNQRAELMAILRALEIAPLEQTVQILTDSQYSINCVTQWALSWDRKGWKTATGGEVKNQDIIRNVLARMTERTKAGANTYYQWVKGHASNQGNVAADRLAVLGARM
ncbi:hypothetical protein AK830_g6180 [Neonectria ditissima]|uniref:Ribonuclease H n=1 Tax=Neonectria ditissima TaxID=78410 RepID=A0A0P7B1P9_9HYPO|nr:hypothetical protein AK830_g6180 [Neonectria ditissima]